MRVVWLKRDVRMHDHEPLVEVVASHEPFIILYIYEPELLHAPWFHSCHLKFINEGLEDYRRSLQAIRKDADIVTRIGSCIDVFDALKTEMGSMKQIVSHHETPESIARTRNEAFRAWCLHEGIEWIEYQQTGVVPDLTNRDENGGWAKRWKQSMMRPEHEPPQCLDNLRVLPSKGVLSGEELGVVSEDESQIVSLQNGGENLARAVLQEFLYSRGEHFNSHISSPNTAWKSCSRLSPYLTWGHISTKTVMKAVWKRRAELAVLKKNKQATGGWPKSLAAFESRIRWRAHFMQKLEDQPSIEKQNMLSAYNDLRNETHWDAKKYKAWISGCTGYPMIDACMRALHQHRWINFRMRAMLVSFASYNLWLDWRRFKNDLAKLFLDYEPGIHYSQIQMQSGTTGINANRIYSVTKQARDQDPAGKFIRSFVPELKQVPTEFIHEPWKMPLAVQKKAGCLIGDTYPKPIVDENETAREARSKFASIKNRKSTKEEAQSVYQKHGSRKRPRGNGKKTVGTSSTRKVKCII